MRDIVDATHFGIVQRRMQVFLANRCASVVIVPSAAAAIAFRQAGGRASLVRIVANGRDVRPDPRDKASLRHDLGLPGEPLVGVFSRLAPWKGQHVAILALTACAGVNCVILGDALFGEEDYARDLLDLVLDLGLSERVFFLGHRADAPLIIQAVDMMVHPSISAEPFGLTLIEAMGLGTPVIASDVGASHEILDGDRYGTLVPAGNAQALAQALNEAFAAPEQYRLKVEAAARRARTIYTVAVMQQAIAEVIEATPIAGKSAEARICSR